MPGAATAAADTRAALSGRASEVAAQGFDTEPELLKILDQSLPDDALIVSDMTILGYWGVLYLDAKRPGGFAYPMSGALGSGVPTALGTVAANPDAVTVVLVGDGGFLMGGHELVTAQQNGFNQIVLLVNDRCYGVLRNYQVQSGRKPVGVSLNSPDFSKLAEGYGIGYRHITTAGELTGALEWALAEVANGSVLIEFEGELRAPGQSV